jgi:glycosyltransferase involved in cell wall biosynthesis
MSAYESQAMETGAPPDAKRRVLSRRACKKILFVTNTNEYGGAEKHLLELIRRLRGPGVQLCILCFEMDLFSERLGADHDVEVITCKKAPRSLLDWVRLFRAFKPDVVVLIYNWLWCFPSIVSFAAWLAGIRRRLSVQHLITPPLVLPPEVSEQWKRRRSIRKTVGRLLGRESPWVTKMIAELPLCVRASLSGPGNLRALAYFCNTTICVSNALRNALVKDFRFPARKLRTCHNGVSLSEFIPSEINGARIRAKLGLHPDEFLLVCAARLSEQKGIDILLQAMARALRNGVRCKCVIVGDGPLRDQLMEQARAMGLSGHVFFEGFQEDVRPYLQASSAFILTSHMEGLPLSILEAMACGLPSIVTDVGGNAEVITHRVDGLIVPRGSVDAIADAISYLANHPQERAQMARMARTRVCEAFDIENAMAKIRRVILS